MLTEVRRGSCTLGKFASNRYAIKGFGSSVSSSENGEK